MKKVKEFIKRNPMRSVLIYFIVLSTIFCFIPNYDGILGGVGALIVLLLTLGFIVFLVRAIIIKVKNVRKNNKEQKQQKEEEIQKYNEALEQIPQMIKDGTYPVIEIDIPLEKGENAYGMFATALIKEKKVTTRTNYGGLTGSIKIMKGVRYRVGSIQHQSESHVEEYKSDIGILYVTDKRFLFKGSKEAVEIKAKDMITVEMNGKYIKIFKKKGKAIKLEFVGTYDLFVPIMQGLNRLSN